MSDVTPIRPGEPASLTFDIRTTVDEHLARARAIVDLVYICHTEHALQNLDNDTLGWALTVVTEQLGEAGNAAARLAKLAHDRQEKGQDA